MFDHVIPVDQGGLSVRENLVYACQRCNAQKHAKTPAQWKQLRVAQGLLWPPVNCSNTLFDLLRDVDEQSAVLLGPAFRAAYPPLRAALSEFCDAVYDEVVWSPDEWRATFCALGAEHAAAVTT